MITYDQIKAASDGILTTNIKGKEYAAVNGRINAFRRLFPQGFISTEIVSMDAGVVVMKATCGYYENGQAVVLGTGMAYEREGSSNINKTSYIENCETSAVGRALGFIGIGCDDSIASAEEVKNAIEAQDAIKAEEVGKKKLTAVRVKAFRSWLKENNVDEAKMLAGMKVEKIEDITEKQHENIISHADDARERWGA